MQILSTIVLAAALVAPACLPPAEEGSAESVQAITPQCPQSACGNGNSPVIDGVYFWMLSSFGVANGQNVAIVAVRRSDGASMRLVAVHDQLFGVDPVSGQILAAGIGLIGTKIRVAVEGTLYRIQIVDVTPTWDHREQFWVGSRSRVEAYKFRYAPVLDPITGRVGPERPLCSLASDDPLDPMIWAVAFTGDNYDPYTKKITLGAETSGWMNIACKDGAPYKMHMIGHTTAAAARLGILTSPAKRAAMLNAWTMHPCDTLWTFTQPGIPITLTESQHLLPSDSPYQTKSGSYEAIWDEHGAVCLDVHRLATSRRENEALKAAIAAQCGSVPPSCASMLATWSQSGAVLTGKPALELGLTL